MKKAIVLALAVTLVFATALYAHDLWVEKEGKVLVVNYGHPGKLDPYTSRYVKGPKAYDASGKEIPMTMKHQGTRTLLTPSKPPAMVTVVYDAGCWVKTTRGWKNISKAEARKQGLEVIDSEKEIEYNRTFWQWNDRFSKPMGLKMEVVPLKNPLSLKVGGKLPIQLLYDGKPLAGARVSSGGTFDKYAQITDSNGRAEFVIKKKGAQYVVAGPHMSPLRNDPDGDVLFERANIAFEVK